MKFNIDITITTTPIGGRTDMTESASIQVEADTYALAMERTFAAMKTCNTFQEFMDKISRETTT